MTHGKVEVREKSTGKIYTVWPVDARALLGSGEYEPADDLTSRIARGEPGFPLKPPVTPTATPATVPSVPTTASETPPPATAAEVPESKTAKRPPRR